MNLPISASAYARAKPSSNNAATTGWRSTKRTLHPIAANTKASRPRPAVASITVGKSFPLIPTALAIASPRPPPNLRR